jgi:triosephosphate isomerase (TIM)
VSKKLVVANWKMHFNPSEASLLVHRLNEKIEPHPDVTIVLCPPFLDLYPIAKEINKHKFKLGSQNVHYLDEGPYTGEISPAMLKGMVEYSIIGHSERRIHFHEDDKLIAKKVAATLRHHIVPILCVGDRLEDHMHGHAKQVVNDQLVADLTSVTGEEVSKLVIAYEPVWAISSGDGHGQAATPDQITPVVKAIRHTISELYGKDVAQAVTVLYGGSVNAEDIGSYLALEGVDGVLVGGASLNYEQFTAIVHAAQKSATQE